MIKLFLIMSLSVSTIAAQDWLEECIAFVTDKKELEVDRCLSLVEDMVKKEEAEVKKLKKKLKYNDGTGVVAMAMGTNYQTQWAKVSARLAYHKRIFAMFKNLTKDQRKWFAKELLSVKSNRTKLAHLKEAYKEASFTQKIALAAQIAAKEVHIAGQKTIIKARLSL